MGNNDNKGLKLSPATESLYLALRSVEAARNYYFTSIADWRGEQDAAAALEENGGHLFDALADMIETEIAEAARMWANDTAHPDTI